MSTTRDRKLNPESGIDLSRLRKVWALANSANPGEAAAARETARRMVEAEGKTLADVPMLLRPGPPAPTPTGFNLFAGFDEYMERQEPGYRAKRDREAAERRQQDTDERDALLARYGSVDAVLAPTPVEAALLEAVRPWCVWFRPPSDPRWVESIDGYDQDRAWDDVSGRVKDAIAAAYPLPATIAEAHSEFLMWEQRDRDRALAVDDADSEQLDLPAQFRREMVRRLLDRELRATSVHDVLIRQRFYIDQAFYQPDIERAVLLDLEALAAQASQMPSKPVDKPRCQMAQGDMFAR